MLLAAVVRSRLCLSSARIAFLCPLPLTLSCLLPYHCFPLPSASYPFIIKVVFLSVSQVHRGVPYLCLWCRVRATSLATRAVLTHSCCCSSSGCVCRDYGDDGQGAAAPKPGTAGGRYVANRATLVYSIVHHESEPKLRLYEPCLMQRSPCAVNNALFYCMPPLLQLSPPKTVTSICLGGGPVGLGVDSDPEDALSCVSAVSLSFRRSDFAPRCPVVQA